MVTQYFQRNVMVSAPFLLDSIWSHLGDGPLYTPVGDYCGMLIEVGRPSTVGCDICWMESWTV